MTKPTAAQAARLGALSTKLAGKAANDDAPKTRGTLGARSFVATVWFSAMSADTAADGSPSFTFPDAVIASEDGRESVRTCVARETHGLVKQAVLAGEDLVAKLAHVGGELRIVGVQIDGEMLTPPRALPKAA